MIHDPGGLLDSAYLEEELRQLGSHTRGSGRWLTKPS